MELIHGLHKEALVEINGKLTRIGDIKVGDVIQGYNIQGTSVRENRVVSVWVKTIDSHLDLKLSDSSNVKVSADSKVLTLMGNWVSPINAFNKNLELHNELTILSLNYVESSLDIVSIEVEPDHNYYVGSLLLHNTGPEGPPGPSR
jgi:hypothetical protein